MDNFVNQMTNVNGQIVSQPQQVPAQVANTAQVQQPVMGIQTTQNNQALFTQEQLNSIISGRINPLNQKIQDLNTQLAQAQQLSQSYLNELTGFKQRETVSKAGVPSKFLDFVVFEANKLAVNGKSFEDAVKEYIASNEFLFTQTQNVSQANTTTTPQVGKVTQEVANPAQTNYVQQPVANQNVGVFTPSQSQVQSTIQTNANAQSYQTQMNAGVAFPNNVQYGATGISIAGNPASANNIESQVDAFLKSHNLKR